MKKNLLFGILFTFIIGAFNIGIVSAKEAADPVVASAIQKYKNKNYLGCLSDLKEYTRNNPQNAVAWYYLGSVNMKLSNKFEAKKAFDRVVELDKIPLLTSYSLQAELCMDDSSQCQYKNFTLDEISKLKANPKEFIDEYNRPKEDVPEAPKDERIVEIEKLISGEYQNNRHPEADNFIKQESMKIEQSKIN